MGLWFCVVLFLFILFFLELVFVDFSNLRRLRSGVADGSVGEVVDDGVLPDGEVDSVEVGEHSAQGEHSVHGAQGELSEHGEQGGFSDVGDDSEVVDEGVVGDGGGVFEGFDVGLKPVKPVIDAVSAEGYARKSRTRASVSSGGAVAERELVRRFSSSRLIDQGLEKPLPVVERVELLGGGASVGVSKGSLVADGKRGVRPGVVWRGEGAGLDVSRFGFEGEGSRLSVPEREFFLRAGGSYRSLVSGESDLGYINPPLFFGESDEERDERVRRITELTRGDVVFRRGSGARFGRKHRETVDFLANFRLAKPSHVSYLFAERPDTSYRRLLGLRDMGLVVDVPVMGTESVWFLTRAGLELSGYDYAPVRSANINYPMLPHMFMVNYIAANVWGASLDVLGEGDGFPAKNRLDGSGSRVFGDYVVSEFAVQSSFGRLRSGRSMSVWLPEVRGLVRREFDRWEGSGGVGLSPERVFGNEFMWVLFPSKVFGVNFHVPDLVVSRERLADGSPGSVAVEFERGSKSVEAYRRTIELYRDDKRLYGSHVWVVHSKGTANKLVRAAEGLGMLESGRMRIVPIVTKDGVFREPQLWLL